MSTEQAREAAGEIFVRLGRLVANGVPLLRALEAIAADTGDRAPHKDILDGILYAMECGKSFPESLKAVRMFPEVLVSAVEDSVRAGRLDFALPQLADSLAKGEYRLGEPVPLATLIASDPAGDLRTATAALVDDLMAQAYAARASDLHIDPDAEGAHIRLRIDGVLQRQTRRLTAEQRSAVVSRIKSIAGMDVAEQAFPQDGRISTVLKRSGEGEPRHVDVRVAACPYVLGEKLVLRFLDRATVPASLEAAGFAPETVERLRAWLRRPSGLIVVSGPAGTGKTITQYLLLGELVRGSERNVLSAEEPVEFLLPGVHQLRLRPSLGFNAAAALRTFSRQDPDVVSTGELRDEETASALARVAQAGHLALVQAHARDEVSTVKLLVDLGVPAFLLREILVGVVCQRLVRKLCPHCRENVIAAERDLLPPELATPDATLFKPAACEKCRGTGYQDRVPVVALFTPEEEFWQALADGASTAELLRALPRTHRTLRVAGMELVRQGLTSFSELDRVLG